MQTELLLLICAIAISGWIAVWIIWRSSRPTRIRYLSRALEASEKLLEERERKNTALKKRTDEQDAEIRQLKADNEALHRNLNAKAAAIELLNKTVDEQGRLIDQQRADMDRLKDRVTELAAKLGMLE